ncbi:MAG: pantoate--beta-alanine ligase [Pseudomonadota bacterium]|nr:pantoate--beta-alanine ligase [Pseudomonadota bacterium]
MKSDSSPIILNTVSDLRTFLAPARGNSKKVGFVPTMGNLHQGHLDLVYKASYMSDVVVVSIFVNPMQFGPHEDFDAYPRTLEADCKALNNHPCDAVFAPTVREVYPKGVNTEIDLPSLTTILCGHHRPGHFKGVATVVAKLMNIVQPDVAVFGSKDYQQLQVIQTMVADLLIPVTIVAADTTRETSGLAMSSRNAYLTAEEKETAAMLYTTLKRIGDALRSGSQVSTILRQEKERLTAAGFVLDYLEIRDAQDLSKSYVEATSAVILVAAKLGRARLIDNLVIELKH